MRKKLSFFLTILIFAAYTPGQSTSKPDETNNKIGKAAAKVKQMIKTADSTGTANFTVTLKKDGERQGYIRQIMEDGFIVKDAKSGLAAFIPYLQVKKIESRRISYNLQQLRDKPSLKAYWENFFARTINDSAIGYSYAIYQNSRPVAVGAYGYDKYPQLPANSGIRMTPQTRMQIASVSKPITAVALLHAMENKGISPDTKFWPLIKSQFPVAFTPGKWVEDITIAQLLTHTSGYSFGYIETPRLKNLQELLIKPVSTEPGKENVYSNINFSIARTLIESLTGQDYEQYVKNEIFRPVGAEFARLKVGENEAAFAYQPDELVGAPMAIDFSDEGGAYGWYATVEEIAKFLGGVRTRKYLSETDTEQMFKKGLGWGTTETPAGTIYRHEGQWVIENNRGVRSGVALLPDGTDAVLFINTNSKISASELLVRGFSENIPRIIATNLNDSSARVVRVELPAHVENVRCTTDGSTPNSSSGIYSLPVKVTAPAVIKCLGFIANTPVTTINTLNLK